ncbi:GH32 C-terminal domain-containing protein [uncultured Nevskia sp.]|uniref:GH32 C-terminal domain-containing protein n=1 Tax=uncultured Nevskia sp. TaxID=228950 RepID=UPI00345DA584
MPYAFSASSSSGVAQQSVRQGEQFHARRADHDQAVRGSQSHVHVDVGRQLDSGQCARFHIRFHHPAVGAEQQHRTVITYRAAEQAFGVVRSQALPASDLADGIGVLS